MSQAPPQSKIGYLPVINASPTELGTVRKVLENAVHVAEQLRQESIVLVLDQAIYAKAQEILWKLEPSDPMSKVVVRHTVGTFLAVLGKRFADAGLRDILVEADIIASGSVDAALDGKHYNRAVRAHKVVTEALQRLRWQEFETWLKATKHGLPDLEAILLCLSTIRYKADSDSRKQRFAQLLKLAPFLALQELFEEFSSKTRQQPMAQWHIFGEAALTWFLS